MSAFTYSGPVTLSVYADMRGIDMQAAAREMSSLLLSRQWESRVIETPGSSFTDPDGTEIVDLPARMVVYYRASTSGVPS